MLVFEREHHLFHLAATNRIQAVERLAREKLGYAKPGEVVIRFQEPTASAPGAP